MLLPLRGGELRLQPPCVYQDQDGVRTMIRSRYVLHGRDIGFELGAYDPALELTIDPIVTFSTLLGGGGNETAVGCAVDNQGNMVAVGSTSSTDFPLKNALAIAPRGISTYVTTFDRNGTLVHSTYFGGTSGSTTPIGVGFDPVGWATLMGPADWFFTALDASGALAWCTYWGGQNGGGNMTALHVLDVLRGSVIAVGRDTQMPLAPNAYSGVGDIAVAGVQGGNVLWVGTQCGFSGTPTAIHVTRNGHICVTGWTMGPGLPTTGTSFQQNPVGWIDGFVLVFFGTANSLVYATYFGGTVSDVPHRIHAVSGPGTVHCTIAGETTSPDLPLANALQTQLKGKGDCFVARLNGNGSGLDFCTCWMWAPGVNARPIVGPSGSNASPCACRLAPRSAGSAPTAPRGVVSVPLADVAVRWEGCDPGRRRTPPVPSRHRRSLVLIS